MKIDDRIKPKSSAEDISLKEVISVLRGLFRYLFSKWHVIFLSILIGASVGYWYSTTKKTIYSASTTFVLEDGASNAGLGNLGGLASMVGMTVNGGGGIFQGDNILELYKSRKMIEKTLLTKVDVGKKRELLVDRYIEINKLRQAWVKNPKLESISFHDSNDESFSQGFSRLQDSVLGVIVADINKNCLNVSKPDKKLNIINAEVNSSDEFFAKNFNEQIVKNVNDFYVRTRTKKSQSNISILQNKTDSVRAVMNGAIYTAAAVADATPNLNLTRQVKRVAPVQRSQFTAETNKLILGELMKNLEMTKMSLLNETPLIQVIDSPVFPLPKQSFGKIKGIIIGMAMAGMVSVFFLIIRRISKRASN